jgi:hypothetical protein
LNVQLTLMDELRERVQHLEGLKQREDMEAAAEQDESLVMRSSNASPRGPLGSR